MNNANIMHSFSSHTAFTSYCLKLKSNKRHVRHSSWLIIFSRQTNSLCHQLQLASLASKWIPSQLNVKGFLEICWPVIMKKKTHLCLGGSCDRWYLKMIWDVLTSSPSLKLHPCITRWCGNAHLNEGVLFCHTAAYISLTTVYGDICHTCCTVQHKSRKSDNQSKNLLFVYFIDWPRAPQLQFHACICKTNHRISCLKLLKAWGSQSSIIKNVKSQLDLGRHSWALSSKDDVCALPWVLHYRERGPVCMANSSVIFLGKERFERAAARWKLAPLRWRS